MQHNVRFALVIGTLCAFLWSSALPDLRITWFAPAIVMTWYRRSHVQSLAVAALGGILTDLLASNIRFGMHALVYVIATLCLYERRRHFFEDSWSTFPLLTILFSAVSTAFLSFLTGSWSGSPSWIATDLVIMPCLDGLFCLVAVTLPLMFWTSKATQVE